jgi:dipeptidyl aminopeptidase/acylaminoacyl peptidase
MRKRKDPFNAVSKGRATPGSYGSTANQLCLAGCLTAVLLTASISSAGVEHPLPPLRAEDIYQIAYAMNPTLTHDGKIIAYVREWMDIASDRYRRQLWLIDSDGMHAHAITADTESVGAPIWSPDGARVAYTADEVANGTQIHVYERSRETSVQLTQLPTSPSNLAWSPDGLRHAFVMKVAAHPSPPLGRIAIPPAGAKWQPPPYVIDRLRYHFDDTGYVGDEGYDVFVVTVATRSVQRLTHGEALFGGPLAALGTLSWTPDGRSIVISAHTAHEAQYTPRESDIYKIDAASGTVVRVTDTAGGENQAAVSPDGNWIAFTRILPSDVNYQDPKLYVVSAAGGAMRAVSTRLDRPIRVLQWAANSRSIYAAYDDSGISRLGRFQLDGSLAAVAENLGSWGLAYVWGEAFSVSANGTFVINTSDANSPGDVAVGNVRDRRLRRVTALSQSFLAQRAHSRIESFSVKVNSDGLTIAGWLVKPPGFDPLKTYPLILSIHGGPYLYFGPRWDFRHEVMAGEGYVVAYINPRGSVGYGQAFAQMTDKTFPGAEYADFDTAADYLAALPFVDRHRLYITGGSAGGTLTSFIIGHTARYRAAGVEYPVTDYRSWSLLADNPADYTYRWSGGLPWEKPEQYARLSPLSYVGTVTTPTILMCGEDDGRTPISQCDGYYVALKLRGIAAALIRYPAEPHEIERYPSDRVSEINLLLGWFARYGGSSAEQKPP